MLCTEAMVATSPLSIPIYYDHTRGQFDRTDQMPGGLVHSGTPL